MNEEDKELDELLTWWVNLDVSLRRHYCLNMLGHGITEKELTRDVGRNELCPCGSGKKFKKCCMK